MNKCQHPHPFAWIIGRDNDVGSDHSEYWWERHQCHTKGKVVGTMEEAELLLEADRETSH